VSIQNAIIKSYTLSNADHGCLTLWINLDFGGSGQGFGGYNLYSKAAKNSANYAGLFIWRILEITDVTDLHKIIGKTIRIDGSHSGIKAIGHIIKDDWFNPLEEFKTLEK